MQNVEEVKRVTDQIVKHFSPDKVILFGSQAKGTAGEESDIDLCIVMQTKDRRETLCELYLLIESEIPVDLILYTPEQWASCAAEEGSFASLILEKGMVVYERFLAV